VTALLANDARFREHASKGDCAVDRRLLIGLCLLLFASPAHADMTAIYKSPSKTFDMTMTVEIADDGRVRYQMSVGNTYGLVIDDIDYFVQVDPQGPIVQRVSDLMTVQKEAIAGFLDKVPQPPKNEGPELIEVGKVTIHGREGRAYIYTSQRGSKGAAPVAVISDDPNLAPLGRVMANQFSKSMTMMGGMVGHAPSMATEMDKILHTGTAISFSGMELTTVNDAKIDPKRFDLPAEPLTLDQIRQRMKPLPPPPTASPDNPKPL
jgi:hypothetical protein